MPLIIDSVNSARQPVLFQLLKPIGGVRACPSGRAWAGARGITTVAAIVANTVSRVFTLPEASGASRTLAR